MKKQINLVLFLIIIMFGLAACSEDNNSNPIGGNEDKAAVKGKVTDDDSYGQSLSKVNSGIEGATVTTAEIQSNGSLQTTSETSVQTDVNGVFEVNSNSVGKSNVVVTAMKGSSEWKAIISSNLSAGSNNYCPPLNEESTAEVDVYTEVVAKNKSNIVGYYDVAFQVSGDIAASIKSNSVSKTEIANAIITKSEARATVLKDSHYGYSNSQYEEAKKVDEETQKDFEQDLYFSNNTEASYNAAWEKYFDAKVEGYNNTSISMNHYAESEEISNKAMIKFNGNIESNSKFELEKHNAYLKAKLIAKAMKEEHEKAGASEQHSQKVDEENNNLLISIKNSTSTSGIAQAFSNYRASIKANLKSAFSSMSTSLSVVETSIETTLKATFDASVTAAANIQALITAYTAFSASINATVSGELSISNTEQIKAIANIYTMIYMQS